MKVNYKMNEKDRLCAAVDEFADAMKKRLIQKQKQGYDGWASGSIAAYGIPARLFYKASEVWAVVNFSEKKISKKSLVDIANFAMFLWRKLKE